MNKLVVICGPTCTGKTSLAIGLCKKVSSKGRPASGWHGEIVSADSRQIYKFMDIGTGKMPAISTKVGTVPNYTVGEGFWVVDGVYIRLYDVVEPDRKFSVARFKDAATREIESMWRRKKIPFLVGGTGFYVAAVLGETAFPRVPPDWNLRRELEKLSVEELFEKLQKLDLERSKTIDPKNPRRLVRAIEIAMAENVVAGLVPAQREATTRVATTDVLKIGLTAPRELLYQNADAWAEKIVNNGLLDEVHDLVNRGYRNTLPMKRIIYQAALDHLDGKVAKEEMLQRIKFDLHGYIRRQLTWFRRDKEIQWFDLAEPDCGKKVEKLVESFLKDG